MRPTLYKVTLTAEEHDELNKLVKRGTENARTINRARVLLYSHAGKTNIEIQEALSLSGTAVTDIRHRFQRERLNLLHDKPRPGQPKKVDGKLEALIVATACSTPPEGTDHWTMRMIAQKVVQLEAVDYISHKTVWEHLKKTKRSRGSRKNGA
jgi:transposase